MADKYIFHGATFNGDGTSSAEATSNGGVGAWNNINVQEGVAPAYGVLAAGDTINIRSKDSAGNDITRTISSNTTFGTSAATSAGWVTWVIDDGTVWPGVVGVIRYTNSASFGYLIRSYNHVIAKNLGAFVMAVTGSGTPTLFNTTGAVEARMTNPVFDSTGQTGAGYVQWNIAATVMTMENPLLSVRSFGGNGIYLNTTGAFLSMVNPDIRVAVASPYIFRLNDIAEVRTFGGRISGAATVGGGMAVGAVSGVYAGRLNLVGTQYPIEMALYSENPTWTSTTKSEASSLWSDASLGAEFANAAGEYTSRDDGNFPYLDAMFPNPDESGWSWRCYGRRASAGLPLELSLVKQLSDGGSTRDIAVELLVANGFVGQLNRNNTYVVGSYVDDVTGNLVGFSTKSTGALEVSDATWSSNTYGAVNMGAGKRRIKYTTPSAVKSGSKVFVRLYCTKPAIGVSDYFFVSPDIRVV